jgi:hypothetical protein
VQEGNAGWACIRRATRYASQANMNNVAHFFTDSHVKSYFCVVPGVFQVESRKIPL